ncbi:MAG: PEGA domain-containing protein [Vulcanimicrobiaceae bacterium]
MRVLLAMVLAVILLGATSLPSPSGATPSGAVYVTTLPSQAGVWIDGTYVGRSPIYVDGLLAGHHSLTVTKTGWEAYDGAVDVVAGGVAMASTRLEAADGAIDPAGSGLLVVLGTPPGAKLSLDGAPFRGKPGAPLRVADGLHALVETSGGNALARSVTVLPQTTTAVIFEAPPSAGDARSAVIAPAESYVPASAISLEGNKVVVRYLGHVVVGHIGERAIRFDGKPVAYGGAPQTIGGKLYLPLELLVRLRDLASAPQP